MANYPKTDHPPDCSHRNARHRPITRPTVANRSHRSRGPGTQLAIAVMRGRPPPVEPGGVARKLLPAQKLLDSLQHWTKPTVSARAICIYGPNSLRDRENAIASAEILVKHGW